MWLKVFGAFTHTAGNAFKAKLLPLGVRSNVHASMFDVCKRAISSA